MPCAMGDLVDAMQTGQTPRCCPPPPPRCRRLADHADCADGDVHVPGHGGADCVPGGAVRQLRVWAVRQPHDAGVRGEDPRAGGRRGLPGQLLGHERGHHHAAGAGARRRAHCHHHRLLSPYPPGGGLGGAAMAAAQAMPPGCCWVHQGRQQDAAERQRFSQVLCRDANTQASKNLKQQWLNAAVSPHLAAPSPTPRCCSSSRRCCPRWASPPP